MHHSDLTGFNGGTKTLKFTIDTKHLHHPNKTLRIITFEITLQHFKPSFNSFNKKERAVIKKK